MTAESEKPILYRVVIETVHSTEPQDFYFSYSPKSERYAGDEFAEVANKVAEYFGPEFGDNGFIKTITRIGHEIINI